MALGTAMAFHAPAGVGRFDLSAAKLAGPLQRMSAPPLRLKTSAMGRRREVNGLTSLRGMAGTPPMLFGKHELRTEAPKVQISVDKTAPEAWEGDLLVVPIFAPGGDDKEALAVVDGIAKTIDDKTDGAITEMVEVNEFKGKDGSSAIVRLPKSSPVRKLSVVGAGDAKKFDVDSAMKLANSLAATIKTEKAKKAAVVLPAGTDAEGVKAMAQTVLSALYHDARFKSSADDNKPPVLETLHFLSAPDGAEAAIEEAPKIVEGVRLAKDLVSAPANYITPTKLAEAAEQIAKEHGLACKIMDRAECEKLGMGAYLAVSQGACEPPKFIHLTYKPKGEVKKKVAVVGKGLTFDSGGYNIKAGPGSMIEMMKFDMGGSAAALGAAKAVGALQPEGVEAHFIVAACENMVSAEAMRPGDILTASNGKTIEVINTDAEGRLTLADALIYAEETAGADEIVDIATLTGAMIVALGPLYAGFWSSDEALAEALRASFKATGEKAWQMPLCAEYAENLKSPIADLKNLGGKGGGSITAALFLKEFVKKAKWAHIDVAGPVWSDKSGATGYGVKTLTNWIIAQGK